MLKLIRDLGLYVQGQVTIRGTKFERGRVEQKNNHLLHRAAPLPFLVTDHPCINIGSVRRGMCKQLFVFHGKLRHLVHAQQHMYSFVVCYDKDDRLSTSCRHEELRFTYI